MYPTAPFTGYLWTYARRWPAKQAASPQALNGLHAETPPIGGAQRAAAAPRLDATGGDLCKQTNRSRFILVQSAQQNCSGMRG